VSALGRHRKTDVLSAYREAGIASAAAAHVADLQPDHLGVDPTAAAFFDVDNTVMRGASIFHLAVGLARRRYFSLPEITSFASKQVKFVISGSEDLEDMASATEAALSFVEGRSVTELTTLGEQIFDDIMVDKLIPGTLALAQAHLDAGQRVWLVTATPAEVATLIAQRLGLTGALGTVAEVTDGYYTGRLVGAPLHGQAKAEAIRAIAQREGLDLSRCSAYSDSANDIPMLSMVGSPCAVNPDAQLRDHARAQGWAIYDFRKRAKVRAAAGPIALSGGGIAVGLAVGYAVGRVARR
jgi:HAD superfamily hydrolase (TIGR01490 family)